MSDSKATRTVYEFEVELRLTNKNTRAVSRVTRNEWAYSVDQAFMQAVVNEAAGNSSSEIECIHIGPTTDAIRNSSLRLAYEVDEAMKRLSKTKAIT